MRNNGIDERIRSFEVNKPILGFAASHNDCHGGNWLIPHASPTVPVLVDLETIRLDSPAIDIGVLFADSGKKFPDKSERKRVIDVYLKLYFDKYLLEDLEMERKFGGKTFEEFYESVFEEFELECLKGCALRCYFLISIFLYKNWP